MATDPVHHVSRSEWLESELTRLRAQLAESRDESASLLESLRVNAREAGRAESFLRAWLAHAAAETEVVCAECLGTGRDLSGIVLSEYAEPHDLQNIDERVRFAEEDYGLDDCAHPRCFNGWDICVDPPIDAIGGEA